MYFMQKLFRGIFLLQTYLMIQNSEYFKQTHGVVENLTHCMYSKRSFKMCEF